MVSLARQLRSLARVNVRVSGAFPSFHYRDSETGRFLKVSTVNARLASRRRTLRLARVAAPRTQPTETPERRAARLPIVSSEISETVPSVEEEEISEEVERIYSVGQVTVYFSYKGDEKRRNVIQVEVHFEDVTFSERVTAKMIHERFVESAIENAPSTQPWPEWSFADMLDVASSEPHKTGIEWTGETTRWSNEIQIRYEDLKSGKSARVWGENPESASI